MSKYEEYINNKKTVENIIRNLGHFLEDDKRVDKKYFRLKEDYLDYLSWGEHGNSGSYSVKSKELNNELKKTIECSRTYLIEKTIKRLAENLETQRLEAVAEAKSVIGSIGNE